MTYVTEIIIKMKKKKSKYAGQLVIGNRMKVKSLKYINAFQTGCVRKISGIFPVIIQLNFDNCLIEC